MHHKMNFMLKHIKGFTIAVANRIDIFFFILYLHRTMYCIIGGYVSESVILKVVLLLLRQSSNLGSEKLF